MEKDFYLEKEKLKKDMNADMAEEIETYQTELDKLMNRNDQLESSNLSQTNLIKKLED